MLFYHIPVPSLVVQYTDSSGCGSKCSACDWYIMHGILVSIWQFGAYALNISCIAIGLSLFLNCAVSKNYASKLQGKSDTSCIVRPQSNLRKCFVLYANLSFFSFLCMNQRTSSGGNSVRWDLACGWYPLFYLYCHFSIDVNSSLYMQQAIILCNVNWQSTTLLACAVQTCHSLMYWSQCTHVFVCIGNGPVKPVRHGRTPLLRL